MNGVVDICMGSPFPMVHMLRSLVFRGDEAFTVAQRSIDLLGILFYFKLKLILQLKIIEKQTMNVFLLR